MTLFRLENISKSYIKDDRQRLEILKNINLEISKGDFVTIIGKSGSGKSTILHLMAALDKPTEGKIYFRDSELNVMNDDELSAFRNAHIGFVFQFHHLLPEFSAFENVMIPALIHPKNSRTENEKRAKELLDMVGLTDRIHHKPSQMSGGEQQRVAIARALMNKPEVIFADEPTGNLDTANSEIIFQLLDKLHSELGTTLVVVTHNDELARSGTTKLHLKDGVFIHRESSILNAN